MTINHRPEAMVEVAAEEEEGVTDPRGTKGNSFVTFMGQIPTTEPTSAQKKKKTLERMKAEKKAKLVGHTTWSQPQQIQYLPPTTNPIFTSTLTLYPSTPTPHLLLQPIC
jgi:hypothetical protein